MKIFPFVKDFDTFVKYFKSKKNTNIIFFDYHCIVFEFVFFKIFK